MPPLRRSAIARAFTSAVQFKMHAPTTLPPWQVPWGSEMADGFLQTTKPTTIIILAERSNLLFTRSGATASSLCLSHDSDFGGGRLSCDFEEENVHFSEIFNCFKNDQVQNSYQNIYETAKQKRVFDESAKVPFLLSSLWNLLPVFIVVTPASDECLNFGHLPAVIAVPRACVCIFVDRR